MKKISVFLICFIFLMAGCSSNQNDGHLKNDYANNIVEESTASQLKDTEDRDSISTSIEEAEKPIKEIDLTDYFQGIEGCAVIYDEINGEYLIYNRELTEKRTSPYSTFKIVSALIGLKSQVIENENTIMNWNGTIYSVDEWNNDLSLKQAFQSSCIWYFREVIDNAGKDLVQQTLSELSYGNCDISQWEGRGINKSYNELNGFWLESSLLISPKEQVKSLIQIFSNKAKENETFIPILKDIMLVENNDNICIYGKTGTGHKSAWFVGFADNGYKILYFSVLLNDPTKDDISGQKAKEILLNIIKTY